MLVTKDDARTRILEYCRTNGYNEKKAEKLHLQYIIDTWYFLAYDSSIRPNGLMNDMKTMPDTIFILKEDGSILETEKTKAFFM